MTELGVGDREAIRALVDGYARAVDGRDVDAFVALFAEDAELDVYEPDGSRRGGYCGATELAHLPPRLARYVRTDHRVLSHVARVGVAEASLGDGGQLEADGETTCEAHHVRVVDDAGEDLVMAVRYLDRYRRTTDGWRITRREVRVESTATKAVSPS